MAKVKTKYEGDDGSIMVIRTSAPASGDFTNTAPTAAVGSKLKPKLSKNKAEYGLRPRYLILERTVAYTAPSAFTRSLRTRVPVLTKAIWNGTTTALDATVKWQTFDWKVAGREEEDY